MILPVLSTWTNKVRIMRVTN
ncbi:hypothetical protein KGM_203705 [Danaus plexippus plexippus]|uniref:Uncharacterized protein n=1 Tax=Danaus plexippus plexippus TaxID=278856 RepID=A0A212ET56_DANPL|nr:hypothetical protein KGM_203705 [Danaus plexippus plexippus]